MWNPLKASPDDEKRSLGSYSRISVTEEPDNGVESFPSLEDEPLDSFGETDAVAFCDSEQEELDGILRPGDHVYVWRSFGVPRAYQRHGIILSADPNKENDPDSVTVVSFYHREDQEREADNNKTEQQSSSEPFLDEGKTPSRDNEQEKPGSACKAVRKESLATFCQNARVHKVTYGSGVAKRLLSRAGTVTACKADERGLVLARAQYLVENPTKLPKHHMLSANGECAAVWCQIGRWCTLQGSSILHIMFLGQAGGAAAGGLVASNLFLWTPMPGYWGAIGFWWYVPATIAYPVICPLLVTFGLMSLVPLEVLRRYRKKWKTITFSLNHDFWLNASEEVKNEYFGVAESSDVEWLKEFFGMDKEESERGRYMPLNTEGNGDDEEEDDDDGILERHHENLAAVYQMDEGAGYPPAKQNLFLQQMDMVKQKWNKSWTDYTTRIRGGQPVETENDVAVPLTNEGSKRMVSLGQPKWRSWSSRGEGGVGKENQNVLQKLTKSLSWTNRGTKNRTAPSLTALNVLDEDEDAQL